MGPTQADPEPAATPDADPVRGAGGPTAAVSPRSRAVATALALLLGILGAHRFYVGKPTTAVLMILTLGGLGLWVLVDLVVILLGRFRDKQGRRLVNWQVG